MEETTLFCPTRLHESWGPLLAHQWRAVYPNLFDDVDVRLALNQPRYHFVEWFVAIHLYHTYGLRTLLKKYVPRFRKANPSKVEIFEKIVGPETAAKLSRELIGMPPDLFLYRPADSSYRFVEVKAPTDRVMPEQRRNHEWIESHLEVSADIVRVKWIG